MRSPDYKRFLLFVFLAIVLYITLISLLLYYESRTPGALINHIHEAIWFSVVTLTTVGYGDIYPITMGGKIFTFFILLIGVGIVTIPAGLVASALSKARGIEEKENEEKFNINPTIDL